MITERNKNILNKLMEYTIPKDIVPVYDLLAKYPERLRFVKDHNGVKNLVFISTAPSESFIFEVPYFSIITKKKGKAPHTFESKVSYTPEDIYKEIETFFKSTNEILFVGIGFAENEVTKEDYLEILNMMEETKCNIVDAFVTLRRFPDWYNEEAELPFYINKEKEYLKQFEESEKAFLIQKKQEILSSLHQVVEENDEEKFHKLSNQIRNINKQLKEYAKQ
ncbi:hypothetical protein bcgnr5369_24640 [Bacillus cereus]|uniref:Uncharacterized protein n=3 Tax=Bacillus cereus group TaxID=86661 RepID=A0A9X6ZQG0_BACTU|nr:hypothetical protein [Bacillus cereus]PFJ30269.1 hypothetical protein COJ15_31170 [Bacillus thuringiensis]PGP12488.1 hypothetical protein COA01_32235 [Bacillus cereus]